jgi:hypothetical protein
MDPITLIPLVISLVKEGPEMVTFAENTYKLFTNGNLTADQLASLWTDAATGFQAAKAKWQAAGQQPAS